MSALFHSYLCGRKATEWLINMQDLYKLVTRFRTAIDEAKENREFIQDFRFCNFPQGCCDDTCDLLAKYLHEHGIRTTQASGIYCDGNPENNTNHAWLLLDNITVIDITGDQFKWDDIFLRNNNPIYIGSENNFYHLFEDIRVYENFDVNSQPRLHGLYQKIKEYIR